MESNYTARLNCFLKHERNLLLTRSYVNHNHNKTNLDRNPSMEKQFEANFMQVNSLDLTKLLV